MSDRPRLIAILLLALTFIIGGLTGMALEEALGIDWFEFLDEDSDDVDARLLTGLNLTADQRERVDDILEREEDRLERYWESRLPEIQVMLRESYAEIRSILGPEQQEVFDRRVERMEGRIPEEIRD
ncbi:MAG: hypothetical protein KFH98_06615 [Gemmatimonadetes bacterium]|nr:hypothetical protein [Gemmatimonadota bacterium]